MAALRIAYSYIRFSSPEQRKGDSLRRQTEDAEAYCRRRGWALDRTLTLRDLGVSAFRGDNALVGNLGVFLDAIRRKKVLPGSVLIVENIDRISRQGIDEGYDHIKAILKAGVNIVTFSPEREYDAESVKKLTKGALELLILLERAAEESETKSQRVAAAWARKKREAGRGPITGRCPAWVRLEGGRFALIPERAAAIRQIFRLSAAGYGLGLICRKLAEQGVSAFGESGRWLKAYVAKILRDRRALGEYQPRLRDGTPDGPPVAGYYPPVVTESDWQACRAGARDRRGRPGRIGPHVNLFRGLIRDARTGDTFFEAAHRAKGTGRAYRTLKNTAASDYAAGPKVSFPAAAFEQAVLQALSEVNPRDILPSNGGVDEAAALAAAHAAAVAELAEANAFMKVNGFSASIGRRVMELEGRIAELGPKLQAAQHHAAHPVSDAWGQYRGLWRTLEQAQDQADARLRLRTILRRIVAEIWLLVVGRGNDRLAAVQVYFVDGQRCRDYLIHYRRPFANGAARREGGWSALSFADTAVPGDLDLRKRDHARRLEKVLASIDLAALLQ
jgi:DNA invertase Pin-like site-specific DNA recombinase